MDEVPDEKTISRPGICCLTHTQTKFAIKRDLCNIHTTDLAQCSFDLLNLGYEIFLRKKGKTIKLYPGMSTAGNKDICKYHNLVKLILGGYFDGDFI